MLAGRVDRLLRADRSGVADNPLIAAVGRCKRVYDEESPRIRLRGSVNALWGLREGRECDPEEAFATEHKWSTQEREAVTDAYSAM